MYSVKAVDYFDIKGRGRVAIFAKKELPPGWRIELGSAIEVDGTIYRVSGVDTASFKPGSKFVGVLLGSSAPSPV